MSNWGIEDVIDLGGNTDGTGPMALRDAYDALKQQNPDLQWGLATVQKLLRVQAVGVTLREACMPAAAAEQY